MGKTILDGSSNFVLKTTLCIRLSATYKQFDRKCFTSDTNKVLGSMMSMKCLRRPRNEPYKRQHCKVNSWLKYTQNNSRGPQRHSVNGSFHKSSVIRTDVSCSLLLALKFLKTLLCLLPLANLKRTFLYLWCHTKHRLMIHM